jgi:hypothetical protein
MLTFLEYRDQNDRAKMADVDSWLSGRSRGGKRDESDQGYLRPREWAILTVAGKNYTLML